MFQNELTAWYRAHARQLSFRQSGDPYCIWVSEIMAQQTRIEAMMPYYERFIKVLPDIASLAAADDDTLHKLWQGLGYYNRVRNMKKCAQVCMEQYDGKLPVTKAELVKLPGIGSYTAGAIASIAGKEKVSAVDGNVIRVFSRIYNIEDDVTQSAVRKHIESLADASLVDPIDIYNQALMELGALVCIPKNPRCSHCPIQQHCQAYRNGTAPFLPNKKKPKERRIESKEFYICTFQDKIRLVKRGETGLLAGLYGFEEEKPEGVIRMSPLQDAVHIFSHVEWHMKGWLCEMKTCDPSYYTIETIENRISIPGAFMPFYRQAAEKIRGNENGKNHY